MRGVHDVVGSPGADGPDLEIVDDDLPFVSLEPVTHRRGRFATLIAATGAVALVGVGALAVTALFGSGGAGSPEAAVRQLADAVSHKDPLAAVDVLVPTEVRSMRQTVRHVTQRAAELKIVDQASQPLAGVDLSVDHLQLSTEPLGDGYAKVTITSGELSASTHQAAMSKILQNAFHNSDTADKTAKVDLAAIAKGSDLPTFVVTVRHDGNWYVSPAYTALEYAREAAGGPAASFGSAQTADVGADSPEAAVSGALHAWQAGNWDRLMALAPPDELPIYDYRAWIDQAAADTHPDFTIDKLTTSSTVNGDTAVVKLDASGTTGSGTDQGKWQVGGTCPTSGFNSSSSSYSSANSSGTLSEGFTSGSTTTLCLAGDLGGVVPFGLLYVGADMNTAATGPVSIEVVREGGRWFVSPVSTVLDALDATIEHLNERNVYPLIGLGYLLPPDAAITLDQSFTVPQSKDLAHVYSFDGTKGQQVVGGSSGSPNVFVEGQLYTTDGTDAGFVSFNPTYGGPPVTLPSTGSYRLVLTYGASAGAQLTLWDAAHAPKNLLTPSDNGGFAIGQTCARSANGQTCTSTTLGGSAEILGSSSAKTAATAPPAVTRGPASTIAVPTTVP
jgi:hypothetical protein